MTGCGSPTGNTSGKTDYKSIDVPVEIINCPSDINITAKDNLIHVWIFGGDLYLSFEGQLKNNSNQVLRYVKYSTRGYLNNEKIFETQEEFIYSVDNLDSGMQANLLFGPSIKKYTNPFPDKIVMEITDCGQY